MMCRLTIALLLLACCSSQAQYLPNSSVAFQFSSLYNPAFSGVDEFTDVKLGYRYQMVGFGSNSPSFINLAANLRIKQPVDLTTNALRSSIGVLGEDAIPKGKKTIHALGFNVFNEKVALIRRLGGGVTYSFHYPLSKSLRMALGATAMIETTKLDLDGIYLGEGREDDPFYTQLMSGSPKQAEVNFRTGILFYSKRFYVGASYLPQSRVQLLSSDLAYADPFYKGTMMAGVTLPLGPGTVIKPSVLGVLQTDNKIAFDYSVKTYLKEKAWFGFTYRDIQAGVLSLGFDFNSMLGVAYSYEMSLGDFQNFNDGSHEIVLDLRLNNFKELTPYSW
jgi:type IX secretion system PorP/SprF family membrane protein